MFLFIYNLLMIFAWPLYRALLLFVPTIRRFHLSREESLAKLERHFSNPENRGGVWLHAASVGELDQALAILREIKRRIPSQKVFISVFSLSVKHPNHPEADCMFHLPLDHFVIWPGIIKRMEPTLFVTMTWDVFPNLLFHLKHKRIPSFLCSGALNKGSSKLRFPMRLFFRPAYSLFSGIGCASELDRTLFLKLYRRPDRLIVTGDSRYDTILHRLRNFRLDPEIRKKLSQIKGKLLLLASTYGADDDALFHQMDSLLDRHPDWSLLVFPHHVDSERLQELQSNLRKENLDFSLFSRERSLAGRRIIIVDKLGILALAYTIADLCYVGGGIHNRIHNTAEPAATGLAVVTGPKIDASPAALLLENGGALFRCKPHQISFKLDQLMDEEALRNGAGKLGKRLIADAAGASSLFYRTFLKEYLER